MGQSVRASEQGLARIDQARQRRGWTKTSTARWWQEAHTSRATLRRFWRRERIQHGAFVAICQTVGVDDWEAIADLSPNAPLSHAPTSHSPTPPLPHSPTPPLPHSPTPPLSPRPTIDWGDAPDIEQFYDRAIELAQLQRWIVKDRAKLIHIGGLGGIGKTTLGVALAEQIQTDFEGVIWRSLTPATPLETVLDTVLDAPTTSLEQSMQQLIQMLSQQRWLLLLDVLNPPELLWEMLQRVTTARHQSCVVVLARTPLPDPIQTLNRAQSLVLSGISVDAATQLLHSCGCRGPVHQIKALARLYSYNPLALKLVSATIQTVFSGHIAPFLEQDGMVLPEPIRLPLSQQLETLPPLEQSLLFWLAIWQEPIALCRLQTHLLQTHLSHPTYPNPAQVLDALSALIRRSLITRHFLADEPSFSLQPMVMAFVIDTFVDAIIAEMQQAQQQDSIEPLTLLRSHCLLRPGTDDILGDRILGQLYRTYVLTMNQDMVAMIERWMAIAQAQPPQEMGYLMGNLQVIKIGLAQV